MEQLSFDFTVRKPVVYTIYRHVHRASQKCYVGLTKMTMERRWQAHKASANTGKGGCVIFRRAIRKYGPDAFDHEVLETCTTLAAANEAEQWWIAHFSSDDETLGYNIDSGGNAKGTHPDTRAKQSASQKRRFSSMTKEQRVAATAKMRASYTPEQQSAWSRARLSKLTPQQLREIGVRAATVSNRRTTEQRREASFKGNATQTPEQRREYARRAQESRRLNKEAA